MSRGLLFPLLMALTGNTWAWADCCDFPGVHLQQTDRVLAQASADLDGDGAPELAVAAADGTIRLYLSDDSGAEPVTLASSTDYSTVDFDPQISTSATSLQFEDVDGDQNPDLVAGTSGGFDGEAAIEVFFGNGDGTLQAPQRQLIDANTALGGVLLVDVDGDGNRDAVAHQLNASNPSNADYTHYLAGDGNGNFGGSLTELPMQIDIQAGVILPNEIYAPDLNDDGLRDLVSLNERHIVWRVNTAGGILTPTNRGELQVTDSTAFDPHLEIADFGQLDSDANLEMAVNSRQEELVYILEFSGGAFSEESYSPIDDAVIAEPRALAITDLDNDGLDDLVLGQLGISNQGRPSLAWYRRTGDGTFATPQRTRVMTGRVIQPFGDNAIAVADLAHEYVRLLHLDDDSRLAPFDFQQKDSNDNNVPLEDRVIADVNGDTDPDIMLLTEGPQIRTLLGDGNGNFTPHSGGPIASSVGAYLASGDFNGDSRLDLAIAGGGNSCEVSIAPGDGNGSFAPQTAADCFDTNPLENVDGLASADFDGQNGPDLVVLNQSTFEILLNPGDGDFSQATHQRAALNDGPRTLLVADLDGQNGPDLIGTEAFNEAINAYLNNGDGTFSNAVTTSHDMTADALGSGDFNNDDIPDLALIDSDGGATGLRILAGNGDGSFAAPPMITMPMAQRSNDLQVLDYNSDNLPDIVVATGSDAGTESPAGSLILFENQGDGTLERVNSYGYTALTTGSLFQAAGADLDGDNDLDLVGTGALGVRIYPQAGSGSVNPNNPPTGQDDSLSRVAGFAVNADLVNLTGITDPDGDTLSFSASSVPSGLSVDGSGQLTGTPDATALANSPHDITLTADDGEAQLDVTVTLTVTNQAPVASNLQPVGIDVGDTLNVDVGAGFNDPDGHDLTFSQQGLPAALSLSSQGILTGTVDQAMVDSAPFTVMVTADDGFTTTDAGVSVTAGNPDGGVVVSDDDDDSGIGGAPSLLALLLALGIWRRRRP